MAIWFVTLGPEWLESPPWDLFNSRVLAIIWLCGETPNMHGSSISHVHVLDKGKDTLALAVKDKSCFLSFRMNYAWLLSAGEEVAWPEIQEAMKLMESDDGDAINKGVAMSLAKYPTWYTQVRETCLKATIEPKLVKVFDQKLSSTLQPESELVDDANKENDEAVKKILSQMQSAASLFKNNKLCELLSSLDAFSARLLSGAALSELLTVLREAPLAMVMGDVLNSYLDRLLLALQNSPAAAAFECKTLSEIEPVSDVMMRLSTEALRIDKAAPPKLCTVLKEFNSRISLQSSLLLPDSGCEEHMAKIKTAKDNIALFNDYRTLIEAVDSYISLGDVAEARVAKADSMLAMEAVLSAKNNLNESMQRLESSAAHIDRDIYDPFLKSTEVHIKEYKALYISDAVSGLTPKLHELKAIAGGGAAGKIWHEGIPKDQPWSALKEATAVSLQNVDKTVLTDSIRNVAMAFKEIRSRHAVFGDTESEEVKDEVTKVIRLARITLIEYLMVSAIMASSLNMENGIEELKTCSQMLSGAKLTSVDIHPAVWESSLKILRRQPLE